MSSSDGQASSRKIVLTSSDGQEFEIDEVVALESQTLKHMIEDDCADNIPVPNVTGPILAKVVEYCKRHVDGPEASDEDLKAFDEQLVKVDRQTLFDLVLAAHYMDIKGLLDLTCKTVADMIRGKSPEEMGKILNIKKDFTPQEEETVRKENEWAFQ